MRTNTVTTKQLNEFIGKALFENVMNGKGLDGWDNYSGPDWSGWLCGPTVTRDSDILNESNFDAALEILGGECENVVEIRHVGHWACGWLKQIMVKADNAAKVNELFGIHKALEDYPVLNDSDYNDRLNDEAESTFTEYQSEFIRNGVKALALLTDIPKDILDEALSDSKGFEIIIRELFNESRAWNGDEDAWVNADHTFAKLYKNMYKEFSSADAVTIVKALDNALFN